MEKMFKIKFKDIDPDTGEISQEKEIGTILCEEKNKEWIKAALYMYEIDNPNRDFYFEEEKVLFENL